MSSIEPTTIKVWEGISVPPIYAPPISEDVAYCAQRIASRFLQSDRREDLRDDHARELANVHGTGAQKLTLYVRTAMGRRHLSREDVAANRTTIDDESIIAGIVRALNDHEVN